MHRYQDSWLHPWCLTHVCLLPLLPQHSPFFAEQLTAFQVWLTMGVENRNPPEQLPIVLQVSAGAGVPLSLPRVSLSLPVPAICPCLSCPLSLDPLAFGSRNTRGISRINESWLCVQQTHMDDPKVLFLPHPVALVKPSPCSGQCVALLSLSEQQIFTVPALACPLSLLCQAETFIFPFSESGIIWKCLLSTWYSPGSVPSLWGRILAAGTHRQVPAGLEGSVGTALTRQLWCLRERK